MKITILNNACFIIESEKTKILVDPYISKDLIKKLDYDYVLISHAHIDHALHLRFFNKPIIATKKLLIKNIDICLEDIIDNDNKCMINDIEIYLTRTKHPHVLQKICFDSLIHSFVIKQRFFISYKSYGFIFKNKDEIIYYSGDTTFNKLLFENIKKEYNPNYCFVNMEDDNWFKFYLLSPLSKKDLLESVFEHPIYPLHKPIDWYLENISLYRNKNIEIYNHKKKGDLI